MISDWLVALFAFVLIGPFRNYLPKALKFLKLSQQFSKISLKCRIHLFKFYQLNKHSMEKEKSVALSSALVSVSQRDWGEGEKSTRERWEAFPSSPAHLFYWFYCWQHGPLRKREGLWDAKNLMINLHSSAHFRYQKRELSNIVSGKITEKIYTNLRLYRWNRKNVP